VTETTGVVVVGAGPSGLAVGACLRKAGLDFVILEKEQTVGSSWRRHYERLHLHTIKKYSALPYMPLPKDYPRYAPRKLVVEYLDNYAKAFALQPRFGETVRSIRRDGGEWLVESTSSSIRAPCVVIASGYNAEPVQPSFPGIEAFKGKVIHARDYANAKPFAGQSVLVIGMGNTGAEVALDLAEQGAHPTISVRGGVHIVPRELFGIPIQMISMLSAYLPGGGNSPLMLRIVDYALGDLSRHGIRRPPGPIAQTRGGRARIPVIDVGTVKKIRESAITVAPDIREVTADSVVFTDGRKIAFDAIIFATGYRANYPDFLQADDAAAMLGEKPVNEASQKSGLYFVGLRTSLAGLLNDISKEAVLIAGDIARRQHPVARAS
jgi:cation diffusion facilitator CzcD-associated flavoprotein CzcO